MPYNCGVRRQVKGHKGRPRLRTECTGQVELFSTGRRKITVTDDGHQICSDAGVLLVNRIDAELGLTEELAACLKDERDPSRVQHSTLDLLRQRVYQIACGYEDGNDATSLRHDAGFVTALGQIPGENELASQPSLCRFEDQTIGNVVRVSLALIEIWAKRQKQKGRKLREIVLDFDSTDDPTHGGQQLSMFHGFYDQHMYHPLLVFDGEGWPVAVVLRPGRAHASAAAVGVLLRIFREIVERLPKSVRILLRADAGFAIPEMYEMCETLGIDYVIGQITHERLREQIVAEMNAAQAIFESTDEKSTIYTDFSYQAHSWKHPRRIVAKAEVMSQGENPRFVVTNLGGTAEHVYAGCYTQRGQAENYIKDLKNALFADRLSCHRFTSNQFRLVLHTIAYMLLFVMRERLVGTELARAQLDTIRLRLIKIGAVIRVTARRIWVSLSSSHPSRDTWLLLARQLAGA